MAKYEHIVTTEESGMSINQILRINYRFSARFRTKMKYQSLVDLNGTPTPLSPESVMSLVSDSLLKQVILNLRISLSISSMKTMI